MICQTKELTNYVRDAYILTNKDLRGVDFLLRVLGARSQHRDSLIQLRKRLYDHRQEAILYITNDPTYKNRTIKNLLDYLSFIEYVESSKIFVKKDPEIVNNIQSLESGRSVTPKKQDVKSSRKRNSRRSIGLKKIIVPTGLFLLFAMIFIAFINAGGENDSSSIKTEILNEISDGTSEGSGQWALWLRSYEEFEDAEKVMNSYDRYRNIKIVKLKDERFHLFEFEDSKALIKDRQTDKVVKKWPNSRIIYINKCQLLVIDNAPFFVCLR